MEQYAKSVKDVDAALNRLNATLLSYKLSPKPPEHTQTPRVQGIPTEVPQSAPDQDVERQYLEGTWPLPIRERTQPAPEGCWAEVLDLRSAQSLHNKIKKEQFLDTCNDIPELIDLRDEHTVCIPLFIVLGRKYLQLGYPDLASAEAYKALLLSDAIQETADENHGDACEALREVIQQQPLMERISLLKTELHTDVDIRNGRFNEPDAETDVEVDVWLRVHYLLLTYRLLSRSLVLCGCYRSAWEYVTRGRKLYGDDPELADIANWIPAYVGHKLRLSDSFPENVNRRWAEGWLRHLAANGYGDSSSWPDSGLVRREVYPWNDFETDRLSELSVLNAQMAEVAPKLEVKAVELPAFVKGHPDPDGKVVTQLGVFAKEDIAPGEIILDETSMLTANNKLLDALCDACSADLPDLDGTDAGNITGCSDCEAVFCSQKCYDLAMESYHPALCDMDVEAIAKDVPPAEAADSLYALLLLRALAMAQTQDCHPLELKEVRNIWGDFHTMSLEEHWRPPSTHMAGIPVGYVFPRTLPFSFEHNVRLPFHMLEKMDIDIFENPQYDVWVFNTLYAKFRGTASARLSGLGGRAIRGPEVSAVHPLWCLANHSCDPNVSWEWGGSIQFTVRSSRSVWVPNVDDDETMAKEGRKVCNEPGIKKGEEVLNHYCDVELPVKERREWAKGSLGGECMCERCVFEGGPVVIEKEPVLPDRIWFNGVWEDCSD